MNNQPPANSGVTRIEREHFLLHVPFQWVAVPGNNPLEFEFRNQTLLEQLIVTVLLAREPFNQVTAKTTAEELGKKRLSAIATLSKGHAIHSPLRYQSSFGQSEVRCSSRDEPQKVRLAFVVRVARTKIVTVALTRYFLDEIGNPFEVYASSIFDFVQVKDPDGPAAE